MWYLMFIMHTIFVHVHQLQMSNWRRNRDSSVNVVMGVMGRTAGVRFSERVYDFPFFTEPRQALGTTQALSNAYR
jgi:hypothetical protein